MVSVKGAVELTTNPIRPIPFSLVSTRLITGRNVFLTKTKVMTPTYWLKASWASARLCLQRRYIPFQTLMPCLPVLGTTPLPRLLPCRYPAQTVEPDGEHLLSALIIICTCLLPETQILKYHLSHLQQEIRVPLSLLEAVYRSHCRSHNGFCNQLSSSWRAHLMLL
jgi:hypothetical protein